MDVILERVIHDAVLDVDYSEYTWWRPLGEGGVSFDDPRKRQITAYVPSDARYFVFVKFSDLAADLSAIIPAFTDANNNFLPPPLGEPFDADYWQPYYIPLRAGLSVVSGPTLFTGVINP